MRLGLLVAALTVSATAADAQDIWRDWTRLTSVQCPSHHVDWMCGDCQLSVIEAFDQTLSERDQRQVVRVADLKRKCENEQMGFTCEFVESLEAYKKLGLMNRFVNFGCRAVKCEEAALCSRMPPVP